MAVATDHTISGNGTKAKPLSIAQAIRTGQYQPVNGFVNLAEGEKLPKDVANGEGYITKDENIWITRSTYFHIFIDKRLIYFLSRIAFISH